ncbi:DUF6286 domain-containing protein [Arthrobacter sp. TMN-37]
MNGPAAGVDEVTQHALRRELHASRAVPSILTGTVVAAVSILLFLEAVLKAVGDPPFLIDLDRLAASLGRLPDLLPASLLVPAGLLVFVVGLMLFLAAVLPGRRARYAVPNGRAAVVVDAEILAATLARRARLAAGVGSEQVLVTVGRRLVEVTVRPTSGIPVDAESVRLAVQEDLRGTVAEPFPAVRVAVAPSGVIGQ